MSGTKLADLPRRMVGHRIAVLGDPVLDCYLYGATHRISREAPVLIVREHSRELRLGGAANTAANLVALGAKTSLLGLIGDDENGRNLMALADAKGIDTSQMTTRSSGYTLTKTRVMAGGLHTRKQQMLRIDRENDGQVDDEDGAAVLRTAVEALDDIDALVISDYGDGALTPIYVEVARKARRKKRTVIVDSRRALTSYRSVSAVTPNEPEVEAALGISLETPAAALEAAARLTKELNLDATLLTRGREGMAVAAKDVDPVLLPAHGGHEAVDVTGAGDTVVAAFTLALAANADVIDAARVANCAASVVVKSVGTATCSTRELTDALAELSS